MKRSKFSLSHYKLMSLKMGGLYPCAAVEVLPGDTFQHATSMLLRLSPLVTPVMHPCHARIHHWFVPHRLTWDHWESFITGGPDGMDASAFPFLRASNSDTYVQVGSLGDYLGVPPPDVSVPWTNPIEFSALPWRAYALIFNEWYRDQDLVTPLVVSKADGYDSTTNTDLQSVAWEKDYYTSARPWTQKGPVVTVPVEGYAPIINDPANPGIRQAPITGPAFTDGRMAVGPLTGTSGNFGPANLGSATEPGFVQVDSPSGMMADLTQVSAAAINDLRLAFALQRYEEARARYGSRYTEYLRYLGVRSSDARLQRPEYLGGGKQTIQFSEVLQTGGDSAGDPTGVGNMQGHGIAGLRSNRYRRFFEEHGYVISVLSIKPRTIYEQGIPRTYNRRVKEDFWQRELQHIGQQEILNKELYVQGVAADDSVFGYQDRYDEYRRQESTVAGQFRTSLLDNWHMARVFSSLPVLNSSFVTSNPTNRIFADQTGNDTVLAMVSHSIQARRMLSQSGTSFIL